MLRASQLNPKILAYTYIFGHYDFNTTPIVPPGIKIVVHSKPDQCLTWDLNGETGWYVGPSMNHYWCVHYYFTITNQVLNCGTVTLIPHEYLFPEVNFENYLKQEVNDIITLFSAPLPTT